MLRNLALIVLTASTVHAHAFVNAINGANGLTAVGLGVTTNGEVARGGTTEQPFQLDTPVMKNLADDPCGATLLAGSVNIAKSIAAIAATNGGELPSVPANGTLTMGIFQVNADGGGPFSAEINDDATGGTWKKIAVTSQPPGKLGLLHNGPANSSITVEIPSNTKCTGGANGNACLIRLNNGGPNTGSVANGAGPFGGCAAVQQGNSLAATGTTKTKAKTTKGASRQKAKAAVDRVISRHFFPSVKAREGATRDVVADLERRQKITAQMLDELKTATGTAIDIPIDKLAGHDDEATLGGNSTKPAANAVLTEQQAVDLKKAVQNAIEQAIVIMSKQDEIDAGAGGQAEAVTDKANADAAAELEAGQITSINAGNAGVGFFQTDVVDSLLGGVATATQGLSEFATNTITAAAKATAAANGKMGKGASKGAGNGKNRKVAGNAQANNAAKLRARSAKFNLASLEEDA